MSDDKIQEMIDDATAWKREEGIADRRGPAHKSEPTRIGKGSFDFMAMAKRMSEKTKAIDAEFDEKVAGCDALIEKHGLEQALTIAACHEGMGRIHAGPRQDPCPRKSPNCAAGRLEYVGKARSYVNSLGRGPLYENAYFYARGFVVDSLSEKAKAYAEGPLKEGSSLIMGGTTGPGKTFCAIAVAAHAKVALGWDDVYFVEVAELIDGWETRKEDVQRAQNCKLLVLDDLGTEMVTDRNQNLLYRILNRRADTMRPTVITCNMTQEDFFSRFSEQRLKDRLETFLKLFTKLPSKRNKPGQKKA